MRNLVLWRIGGAALAFSFVLAATACQRLNLQPFQRRDAARPPRSRNNSAATIAEISLNRICFGCPHSTLLTLRRNGEATLIMTGNARSGTTDQTSRGKVSAKDFDEVVRALVANRFFELDAEYNDPQLQDGASSAITATRGGVQKTVNRRNGVGPSGLDAIEHAIDAVRERIVWTTDPPAVR